MLVDTETCLVISTGVKEFGGRGSGPGPHWASLMKDTPASLSLLQEDEIKGKSLSPERKQDEYFTHIFKYVKLEGLFRVFCQITIGKEEK